MGELASQMKTFKEINEFQKNSIKDLQIKVERLETTKPSTPQSIWTPSTPQDISQKITDLQTTVKLLAPANIQTKNSVLELLSKEIECLLTLKKESPEKEEMVLNKIS